MQKKLKFTENPNFSKTLYGGVIAVLCIAAIIIGIVAAAKKNTNLPVGEIPDDGIEDTITPPDDENNQNGGEENGNGENKEEEKPKPLTFTAPVDGRVVKGHSLTQPVFSTTLEEWRIHTGVDFSCAESAPVFCAAEGEVTAVYYDPMLGNCVEVAHSDTIKTLYANLASDSSIKVGDKLNAGAAIGTVGDSAISELCDEAHLHFELLVNDSPVNPLDYLESAD